MPGAASGKSPGADLLDRGSPRMQLLYLHVSEHCRCPCPTVQQPPPPPHTHTPRLRLAGHRRPGKAAEQGHFPQVLVEGG